MTLFESLTRLLNCRRRNEQAKNYLAEKERLPEASAAAAAPSKPPPDAHPQGRPQTHLQSSAGATSAGNAVKQHTHSAAAGKPEQQQHEALQQRKMQQRAEALQRQQAGAGSGSADQENEPSFELKQAGVECAYLKNEARCMGALA